MAGPGRPSQIKTHPKVDSIERDIVLRRGSRVAIAKRYGVSRDAVERHWVTHLKDDEEKKRKIVLEAQIDEHEQTATALNEDRLDISKTYEALARRVERLISKAEENDDHGLALASMEGLRKVLRDIAQLHGKLAQTLRVEVSVMDSPEWIELRDILEQTFIEHPQAKQRFLQIAGQHRLSIARRPDAE